MRTKLLYSDRVPILEKIIRYERIEKMMYRTNLYVHKERIMAMIQNMYPFISRIYPKFNLELALTIADYHDDIEIIIGDISLQLKLLMNQSEKEILQEKEKMAIKKLLPIYPDKIGEEKKFKTKTILEKAHEKNCLESQFCSFVDKLDGMNEALHEIFAGNIIFLEPVINYLTKTLDNTDQKFFLIKELFKLDNPLFSFPVVNLCDYFDSGRKIATPHTKKSILTKTGIPHYDFWREVTISRFGSDLLTKQIEFH